MAFEEMLISFFQNYSSALAFMSGLMIGDLMIFLGILAGAGKVNFFAVLFFGFLGGLIHDIAFYLVANSRFAHSFKKRLKLSKKRNKLIQIIEKLGNGHYFLPVLMAKFVYGVRDIMILYVAHNNKSFKKYIRTISLADLIWISTVTSIGWLAGRGFTTIVTIFKGFEKWLFILLAGIVLLYLLNKFILAFVLKHLEKYTKKLIKTHFS